jgi:CRISPR/Cas system-associated exonuclease Cas4 (RecB family)
MTSYSQLNTYMRCPDKHHFKYTEELVNAKWWKPAMKKGTYYHELQEARHLGLVSERFEKLTEEIGENGNLFDEEKDEQYDLLWEAHGMLLRWQEQYPYDEDYLSIEEEFEFDGFTGTPDAVIVTDDGVIIRDYKTTANIGRGIVDLQPYYYMWLLERNGYDVLGFEYDYIRSKNPAPITTNKNGTISRLNTVDTTAAKLMDWMLANDAMHVPEYRIRYIELLEDHEKWFRRDYIEKPRDLKPIVSQIYRLRGKMKAYPRGKHLMGYGDACNGCPYTDICLDEINGREPKWDDYREWREL